MNIKKRLITRVLDHRKIIIIGALIIILLHRNIFNLLIILSQFITGEIYITYQDILPAVGIIVTGLFSYLILKVSRQQIIFDQKRELESKLYYIESEIVMVKSFINDAQGCIDSGNDSYDNRLDISTPIWLFNIAINKLKELKATGYRSIGKVDILNCKTNVTNMIDALNDTLRDMKNNKESPESVHLLLMVEVLQDSIFYSDKYIEVLEETREHIRNDINKCKKKLKVL